jgi:hypothetical protein
VHAGRHRGNCHVKTCRDQFLNTGEDLQVFRDTMRITEGVRHGDQFEALNFSDYPCVMAAHHSQADKAYAQGTH